MANNPHKPGSSAAQSFRADEVNALAELLVAMQRGAHTRDLQRIMRSAPMMRVHRKVLAMRASIMRQKDRDQDA